MEVVNCYRAMSEIRKRLRRDILRANFNICKASMSTRVMQFHFFVSVSALDENTRSEGAADA